MSNNIELHIKNLFLFLLFFALFNGCAVKLVADYDAQMSKEIIRISKEVDLFYGQMIEMEPEKRTYSAFKETWLKIEVDLRALILQNKARQKNEESIAIIETTLEKWLKYKAKHKQNSKKATLPPTDANYIAAENIYKESMLSNHRKRFTRLFTAMSVAEEGKNLETGE